MQHRRGLPGLAGHALMHLTGSIEAAGVAPARTPGPGATIAAMPAPDVLTFLRHLSTAATSAVVLLAGCTAIAPGPAGPRYRCEHGIEFTVRFVDDSALLDAGARGYDVLNRDAGGLTPAQTVYSNPRMRAEFGLGASGREAILRYPMLPLVARCLSE